MILLVLGCEPKHELPVVLELHSNWEFRQVGDSLWRSATVPGNVFTDLLDHELIENPLVGTNEEKVQWVSEADWEYRTNFKLSEDLLNKKHAELNFKGLDTYANVYLNDSLILSANNAFRSWQINVKSLLRESNELKIKFTSPGKFEAIEKAKLSYELPEGNRVFTRKAQFHYGWDWGPKLNSTGIWRPIELVFYNEGSIKKLAISNHHISDSLAILNLRFDTLDAYESDHRFEVIVNNELIKIIRDSFPYSNKYTQINIEHPKLWWPHNLGESYLYDIKLVVKEGNRILDCLSTKYGIREVELITQPDSLGESFYFKVNGIPVFAKGANYIPQQSFQNRVLKSDYEQVLQDAVDANMNMLRVWGGGIYEEDLFYELCDEKGIMVWQDFMFACAMYPGDGDFLNSVKEEAIDNVVRLRNHPSIVLWCGNNENSEGWHRWGWQAGRSESEKEEIWSNYLAVFDSILPEVVHSYSDVDYWESSPKYGRGDPKYQFEGDAHDWWVWHDGYPFEHYEEQVPRFMSEFGFQSFPSAELIQLINESDALDLNSAAIQNHQKHNRGFQLIREYMARDFPVPDDPEAYIYMSQLVQAYGITKGIEAHRRAKPYSMGSLFWQLNDCWPAISWSSVDYLGNWKALHYKAKVSFENLLISPRLNGDELEIWVVNDDLFSHQEDLELTISDFNGTIIWEHQKAVKVDPNSSELKVSVNISELELDPSAVVLKVSFKESSRLFYFTKPKNLQLLKDDIKTTVSRTATGFQLELQSSVLHKDVFISTGQRGEFSNNYFDLLPNEPKRIHFKTSADALTDLKTLSFNNFIR